MLASGRRWQQRARWPAKLASTPTWLTTCLQPNGRRCNSTAARPSSRLTHGPFPRPKAIERIAETLGERKLLEVCAGSGLWAKLLADKGVQVVATDPGLTSVCHFAIEALDAEMAVGRHPECDALMLIWPPFKDVCAVKALRAFKGGRVVYIGDSRFTADQAFHEELAKHWRAIAEVRCLPGPAPGTRPVCWKGSGDG